MRRRAAVILLPLLMLFSEPSVGQEGDRPQVEDPAGDAREWDAFTAAHNTCRNAPAQVRNDCYAQAASVPAVGGAPARAEHDILSATFIDTPDSLIATLELGRLVEDLSTSAPNEGDEVSYWVCWEPTIPACGNGGAWQSTLLVVRHHRGGKLEVVSAFARVLDPACGPTGTCVWNVPHVVEPGTPGRIRWTIPRELFQRAELSDILDEPAARVARVVNTYQQVALAASGPFPSQSAASPTSASEVIDVTAPGRAFAFRSARVASPPELFANATVFDLAQEEAALPAFADLMEARLVETPTTITVSLTLAEVDETPADHELLVQFATSGPLNAARIAAVAGERSASTTACGDSNCSKVISFTPQFSVTPGAPGLVNVTFDRQDLGAPARGDLVTAVAITTTVREHRGQDAGPAALDSTTLVSRDTLYYGNPYHLTLDTASLATPEGALATFLDPLGDAEMPADVLDPDASRQFDITYLEVKGLSPGESRFTLGVQDLSSVDIPLAYDAVFYAAAVETADGAFMAGYYKDAGRQEFMCAQDTSVLAPVPADPNGAVWQAIQGIVSVGQAADPTAGSTGSSAGSSITFFVPHTCFAKDIPETLVAERAAAASFVIRNVGGRTPTVLRADVVESDGQVTLGSLVAPRAIPWYVQPFGVENFWDITGIAAAATVSLSGAMLLQRRRGALKRYLAEIESAEVAHASDPRARAAALRELRSRVKRDLVKGSVTDAHFIIIERRLDERLAKARVSTLSLAFGDLSQRLFERLDALISDGTMSARDYEVFCEDLAADQALTEPTKARLRATLRAWVAEDRPNAP